MFGEANTCLWKLWDLCCGLDSQPNFKIGPESTTNEEVEATWEKLASSNMPACLEALAKMAGRKKEEGQGKMKDWSDIPESLFWNKVVQASGLVLFALLITAHVYYA